MYNLSQHKVAATILKVGLLVLFVSSLFFSLFHLSFGMNETAQMPDCPYAASVHHEGALCPMDVGDHLTAWKALTLISPTLIFLTLSILLASLLLSLCRSIWRSWIPFARKIANDRPVYPSRNLYIPRLLQEAFASGIVHPKLF